MNCTRCGHWHKRLIQSMNNEQPELLCLDCIAELLKGR